MSILHKVYFVSLLIILVACQGLPENQDASAKPNILFILADDLGYNDVSCMGSSFYETPNIDRIASQGMTFMNGYAACQVCSPSRASIMTGKNPARHGITDWIGAPIGEAWRNYGRYTKLLPPDYNMHLDHTDTTFPEVLQENGYETFFAGKWHLGHEGSYPEDHGFNINQGGYEKGGPYSGGFFSPFDNPKMTDYQNELGMSLPEKLAKETNQFMEENHDRPFLAFVSFYAVHAPIQTTKSNWSKYKEKAKQQGIDTTGFRMERRMPIRKHQDNPVYAGLIEHMDDAVGQMLDKLNDMGIAENTIVIFTSDNGGVTSGDNYSTNLDPLRGGKGYQWEGGIKVPYIFYVPWLHEKKATSSTRVTGTDFYPTLLDLTGIDTDTNLHSDGTSIKKVLMGNPMEKRSLIWHYPHYGNQGGDPSSIIIKDDWKLIYYHEDESLELYDLATDISEETNLKTQQEKIALELYEELQFKLEEMGAKFPTIDQTYNQDSFDLKYKYYATEKKIQLEKARLEMLSDQWQPNEDWWGSLIVKD